MNEHKILDDLIALLDMHGVVIRMESLDESHGGLCRINGSYILFLDRMAEPDQQVKICAEAILRLINIESVYLKPELRELLETFQKKSYSAVSNSVH